MWFVSENNFETFRGFYCKLGVDLCDVDAFRAAEEGASLGLKPDLQGHTGFNLLKAQFWTPVQRNRVLKKGSESDPLEIKVVPPGGPVFRPLHVANLLKCSFKLKLKASFEADLEGLKAMEPSNLVGGLGAVARVMQPSTGFQGGTGFNLLRAQQETCLKKVSESGPP